jgi:hypothetical protein
MMIKAVRALLAALAALLALTGNAMANGNNTLTGAERAHGWQLLFDGKSLDGWRTSEAAGTFSVRDGEIIVHGPRAHLYYGGEVEQHDFKDFELKIDVLTFPKANSGVYFHTEWQEQGWPDKGYEVQINNSHSDPSRSGALWGVRDSTAVPVPDGQWFTLTIRVQGKHIVTLIDDKPVVDYTEEANPKRAPGLEHRVLSSGTFALQGHDGDSEVRFRNIKVRPLR